MAWKWYTKPKYLVYQFLLISDSTGHAMM